MKKNILLCLAILLLISCQQKSYDAHVYVAPESKQYTYFVNGDTTKKHRLVIPTISETKKEKTTYSLVYSLNPLIENQNNLGLSGSTLYREDNLDLDFKNKIYDYALFGYGYWQLNDQGIAKQSQHLVLDETTDYALLQGDLFNSTSVDNKKFDQYYLATQSLIWESIVDPKTKQNYKIEFENIDLTDIKNTIQKNIEAANVLPNFGGSVYNVSQAQLDNQETISLTDQNQVLSNFDIAHDENIHIVSSSNNKLDFVIKSLSNHSEISFVPRFKLLTTISQIFSSDKDVSYLVIGGDRYNRNVSKLQLEAANAQTNSTLVITTYNSDTKEVIVGAQYELSASADFSNPIQSSVSQINKPAQFNDLSVGTYYVRQIKAPDGYNLNSNVEIYKIEANTQEKEVPFLNKAK